MSDDPFAEPSDAERTIIRPRPSGLAGGRAGGGGAAQPMSPREGRPLPKTGTNPLVAAASPVLAAAVRISSDRGQAPDIDRLRRAMVEAIRRFETEALATGMDTRSLRAARYALCATVDDLVLSTPWGSASSWSQQGVTSIFHNEVTGGERFYDILDQMQKDLGNQEPVVELMYLCMSLGFIGRYRVRPYTMAAWTELREGIYRTIRQRRGDFERELSPQWRGIASGAKPLAQRVPNWALGLGTVACAGLMYVAFVFLLASTSEVSFAELYSLPPRGQVVVPRQVAPPPAPPPPVVVAVASNLAPKLRQFLAPEIKQGLVQVFEDAQTVTVRLANRNMFGSGQATLASSYGPIVRRIGEALNDESGAVTVFGYTDDQPIHTARFPSNFELSQARADAVATTLRAELNDPKRLHAQGRGQSDPIASNATEAGRTQNRRIEIVLVRTSDAM